MARKYHFVLPAILLGGLAGPEGPILAAEPPAATVPATPSRSVQWLDGAVQAIKAGHPDTAITDFLDPLIASYEAQVGPEGPRLYSATSPEESLAYLMHSVTEAKPGPVRGAKVVDSALATAYQLKGYSLVELKRFDEARSVLQKGTEIAPMNPAIWSELGNLLKTERNWPEAMAAYQKAEEGANIVYGRRGDPEKIMLARALRGQGFVLIETGELDKAQALYERCLTLNPNDSAAKQELSYIEGLRRKTRQ